MTNKLTINDFPLEEKRVIVRCDLNVPLSSKAEITDDTRIQAALPTLKLLLEKNCRVIVMSHLGRPKGERQSKYSLEPVSRKLQELLGDTKVLFAQDCIGQEVEKMAENLEKGQLLLLENLRFHASEKANDHAFAQKLATLAQVYINDAFGAAHRAHASTEAITHYLPAITGLLMENELRKLGSLLSEPQQPFVALLGGAKVSDKIDVIQSLIYKAKKILIGGGMAFTFLKAQGHNIGKSLCDDDLETPLKLLQEAKANDTEIVLPVDISLGENLDAGQKLETVSFDAIPDDKMGLDIGPKTVELFQPILQEAKTIFWNGPMGVFEVPPFDQGTRAIAQAIANSSATSCVGGGDSAAAVKQMGLAQEIDHISTGGGASLEFIEGKNLPAVECLLTTHSPITSHS